MQAVSVRETTWGPGWFAVEVETSNLAVTILPNKGADICSIRYKRCGNLEVLWKSPWDPVMPGTLYAPDSATRWMNSYPGGWQVMLPNAGDEATYQGTFYGFHGEASLVPWHWSVEERSESRLTLRFTVALPHVPLRLERRVSLYAETPATVYLRQRVTNDGVETVPCEWGEHIAYGSPFLSEACTFDVPAAAIRTEFESNSRLPLGETAWPLSDEAGQDFRRVLGPESHVADFGILAYLSEGRYTLKNSELNVGVEVKWDLSVMPYVWLWQEFQGSRNHPFHGRSYAMGLEPCSADSHSGVAGSMGNGTAIHLEPHQTREFWLDFHLFSTAP